MVCHRTIFNIGFMEDAIPEQLNIILKRLTEKYERKVPFFEQDEQDPIIIQYVADLWQRIVSSKKYDLQSVEKLERMVNADTLKHNNVREIGIENICYQTWQKLQLSELLLSAGLSEEQVQLAATQVIARASFPASELATTKRIKENSAVCELPDTTKKNLPKTSFTKVP